MRTMNRKRLGAMLAIGITSTVIAAASPAQAAPSCRYGTSYTRGAFVSVTMCTEDGQTWGDYQLYDKEKDGRRAELYFRYNGSSVKFDEVLTGGGTDTGLVTFFIWASGIQFRACTSDANFGRVCDSWR